MAAFGALHHVDEALLHGHHALKEFDASLQEGHARLGVVARGGRRRSTGRSGGAMRHDAREARWLPKVAKIGVTDCRTGALRCKNVHWEQ